MGTSSLVNFQNSAAMFVVNTDEQRPGAEELRLASRLASLVRTTNINMADTDKAVKIDEGDPQSVQDLTGFVPFDIQNVTVFSNFISGLFFLLLLHANGATAVVLQL